MALNTLQNVCGNAFCQAGETFSNCPVDCSPGPKEFIGCVLDSTNCQIAAYTPEVSMFIFFLFLVGLFFYLKGEKII